ncbi:MAG: hypothetical protein RIT32_1056 [Actinomycetota bacterium]|jgi:Flp pilus assembly protein TadG
MVKNLKLERVWQHIRTNNGMVSVELAIGLATLSFVLIAVLYALGIFLMQLNLIDTAHNVARAAARGQNVTPPSHTQISQDFRSGVILIEASRRIDFWFRPIALTATAEVAVE